MKPLFSIVTVCFNSGKTIERTIQSVLAQEFKDYEYIIIDGASTDNTMEVVRQYEPLFEGRLRYTSEPDKGIYDAFNKGIRKAQGHFIWIVNSDDYIDKAALWNIRDIAEAHKCQKVIIEGIARLGNPDGSFSNSTLSTAESRKMNYKKKLLGITHPSSLFSRELYDEIGLYDIEYYILADKDMYLRCYEQDVKFITLDKIITTMSWGGVSTSLNHKKYLHDQWRASHKFGRTPIHTLFIFARIMLMYFNLRFGALCKKLTK